MIALGALLALAYAVPQVPSQDARERFRAGFEAYDAHRFEEALESFRSSLSLFESPNSRLYIARCLSALDREDEAAEAYEEMLGRLEVGGSGDRYAAARDAARAELDLLEPKLGRLRVSLTSTPAEVNVRIGARAFGRDVLGRSVPVKPGAVVVAIDARGAETRLVTDVEAGRTRRLIVDAGLNLEPTRAADPALSAPLGAEERPKPKKPVGAYLIGGTGVAAVVAGGVLWVLQDRRLSALDEKLPPPPAPIVISVAYKNAEVDAINRERIASQALLAAGLVLACVGLVWVIGSD